MRCLLVLSLTLLGAASVQAAPPPSQTLRDASDVLSELQEIPNKSIPANLIADAHAVAIIPNVVKAGFILAGRGGHGVLLTRSANGIWDEPTFINIGGASFGFQAGAQSTDLVLVFRTKKSVERLMEGKGKFTLGADASIAAGPVGRQAEAGTDARLQSEILSYSRSRGIFAGVALNGAVLAPDRSSNADYRDDPKASEKSLNALLKHLGVIAGEKPVNRDLPPTTVVPPPRITPPPVVSDRPPPPAK